MERPDNELLRPREVAAIFGVRPKTIALWAREGKLMPVVTPGGHRRYPMSTIRDLVVSQASEQASETELKRRLVADAVRLYNEGWNIRQVAARFGLTYGVMRRILRAHTPLRGRGGSPYLP